MNTGFRQYFDFGFLWGGIIIFGNISGSPLVGKSNPYR